MAADGPSRGSGRVRVGLVVVHGVGDTEPGYCVNALLDTLAATRPGYRVAPSNDYTRIAEPEAGMPPTVFPVVRRGASHNSGIDIEAVELHWADLTAAQDGRVNTILGLFRVIFESHHLVDAMLDKSRDATAWILRKLLWIAGWMLRGPIAGLTIATSAICALFLFEPASIETDVMSPMWQIVVVQALLFVGAVVVFYRIARQHDYSWYDIVFWVAFASLAVLVTTLNGKLLPLLDHVPQLETGPARQAVVQHANCATAGAAAGCYINGLYKVIIWSWRAWGALLLVATALLGAALGRAWKTGYRAGLAKMSTSIAILIVQFLLWTTVVVTAIYPVLNRAETISTLKAAKPVIDRAIASGEIPRGGPVAKLVQVPDIELDWISRFKFIYASAALTVLIFVVVAFALMEVRQIQARRGLADLERTAQMMPRLLFSPVLVGLLIVAFVLVFALVFIQPYLDRNDVFVSLRNLILPVAALTALVLPFFFGRRIGNVVQFARDLIDHHYQPRLEAACYFFPSVFKARFSRPRRERIQGRLKHVLDNFVRGQRYDGVVFVAHSQGAVIVYDYISDNAPAYGELGGAAPALLTLGSPIGSIYQKYFHEYVPTQAVPSAVAALLKCWINVSRVDDYIGGRVTSPSGLRVENHVMGLGGHTGYWTEPDVAEALDAILTGKVADATKPPPLPPPSATLAVRAISGA